MTVLFADVSGFTGMSEALDPEETHRIMDRVFQLILQWVHRFEGTVNQFLGDGVMALFGAPVALEDAPRRAVLAGLGIQAALRELGDELRASRSIEFRMRIGINTGTVVVGRIGDDLRMDYTAVGDTTNLASRLESMAPPGSVVISDATQRLVAGFFDLRDLGPQDIKGRSSRVRAFEVLRERSARGRLEAVADAGLTPFAGRRRELEFLGTAFESAREGHGQVMFLVGDPGIGKSRLLREFRARLGDQAHNWIEGRCASFGPKTPFLPIADALRRWAGIDDRDDDDTALRKLEEGVRAFGDDLEWTLPFVRQLLSLPIGDEATAALDAATRRSETVRALSTLFIRGAERQPLVFIVEDLHWIDPASEEFLRVLADSIPATRSLLVFTYRPGYRHALGDRSYHTRVAIQVLSSQEMEEMAGSVLERATLPDSLRELVARKAEGNPFFVEEVTKSLLEEGVIRITNGSVELTRELDDVSVPDSIQDILMARIDRLPEAARRAIQVASVIGREFALRLLERISDPGDQVSDVVGELRSLELILQKAAHPELSFMFKHALTHDVAYSSILLERRRALHRLIGFTTEELYADRLAEHFENLSHHFLQAEEWEKALEYAERAAEKAARAYANESVVEDCRRALEIVERIGEVVSAERRARLEKMLGDAQFCLSDYGAAGDAYVRASESDPDPEERAMNLGRAAYAYSWAHSYDRSLTMMRRGLSLSREQELVAGEGMALFAEGWHNAVHGDLEVYEARAEQVLRLGEQSGNEEVIGYARYAQAMHAEWTGNYARAIELLPGVRDIGRRLQMPAFMVWGSWFLGKAYCCIGSYGDALRELESGVTLTDRLGDRAWKSRLLNTLGWCLSEMGSHDRAREYNERGVEIARELDDDEIIANAEINLGRNHLALGNLDRALQYLEPMQESLERRDPWMRWRYSLHLIDSLARVELARGELDRALELADEQLARGRPHRAPKIAARALELRGHVLLQMDRREEAREAAGGSIEAASKIRHPSVQWRGLEILAEVAQRDGDSAGAEAFRAQRRELLTSIGERLPDAGLRRALLASSELTAPGQARTWEI